jgi:hypothetical protein
VAEKSKENLTENSAIHADAKLPFGKENVASLKK